MRKNAIVITFLVWFLIGSTPRLATAADGFAAATDGARIHYVESGVGTPLIFVPGWTMPAEIWRPQIEHFSRTHHVVAIDPRSQGDSSQETEGLDSATRARDIRAVIDKLSLRSFVLVAWSQAVTEAFAYVDQYGTQDIAGLVVVDGLAGGEFDAATVGRIVASLAEFQRDRATATKAFVRAMYRRPQSEKYLDTITKASMRTSTAAALAMSVGALTANYQKTLSLLDKPCLIVSPAASMVDLYKAMRDKMPQAQLVTIEGAGHAVFVDAAVEFNRRLDEFEPIASSSRVAR